MPEPMRNKGERLSQTERPETFLKETDYLEDACDDQTSFSDLKLEN
jgi:hypothetical protein